MAETALRIPAADGYELAATLYEAHEAAPRLGVAVINAALGVPRGYYGDYARFLTREGFHVLTYDYRGIGESRPDRLRGFNAYMHEFGLKDMAGMFAWVEGRYPGLPVVAIGHSVGGQVLGLAEGAERLAGVLTIAAQWPYWRHWEGRGRIPVALLWFVLIPTFSPVLGYFPSRRLGLGEDLPHGVAWEWSRWGRMPNYLFGDAARLSIDGYAELQAPFRAYSFSDDTFAPRPTVDALLEAYPNANAEHIHVTPADVAASKIGHFGFFRPKFRDSLWRETSTWLKGCAG